MKNDFVFTLDREPGDQGTVTQQDVLVRINTLNGIRDAFFKARESEDFDPSVAAHEKVEASAIAIDEFVESITLLPAPGPTPPPADTTDFF